MIEQIAHNILYGLAENHIGTFSYGSRTRNDHSFESDLDLVVICEVVDFSVLKKVGAICKEQEVNCEINPQVMTYDELISCPRQMMPAILHMEGNLLTGELELPEVKVASYLKASLNLLNESLMSIRHYVVSGEICGLPEKKVQRYVKKPLYHGLRFLLFAQSQHCKTNDELENMYPSLLNQDFKQLYEFIEEKVVLNKALILDINLNT